MKSLARFLTEAAASKSLAVQQATRLGYTSDGHGGWYDKQGEFVAKTEGGKLKLYNKNQRIGKRDPDQERSQQSERPVGTQTKTPAQAEKQAQAQAPGQTQSDSAQEEPAGPESTDDLGVLTVSFGRFNPPTIGHQKLMNKAKTVAGKEGTYKIYPSRRQDKNKNPLDPDTKIAAMRLMFSDHGERIQNDAGVRTIFDVLQKANEEGYTSIKLVAGSDRVKEFEKLANEFNGQLYDFEEIDVISAGDRDPDGDGVEGMSSSKLRLAAKENDFPMFQTGIPKSVRDQPSTEQLFKTLQVALKVNKKTVGGKKVGGKKKEQKESYDLWQIAPKLDLRNLRENYMNKAIFKVGDLIENLNTGLVGKVIRRGTNYLICVTENDIMFKSWIYDLAEYTEKKMERRMRDKTHPNTLVGTGGYRKNALAATPGQGKIRNFNIEEFINKYRKNK